MGSTTIEDKNDLNAELVSGNGRIIDILFLLVGVFLVMLGTPRFIGALVSIPGDSVQFELTRGRPVSSDALRLLVENREMALRWTDEPAYYRDIGTATLLLAYRSGASKPESTLLLQQAMAALRSALRLAPVDPGSWARLAYVTERLNGPTSQIIADLTASVETGRYDPGALESRLRLALAVWSQFDASDRRLYAEQIRILWREDEQALVEISRLPMAYSIVIQALAPNDQAIEKLRALRNQSPTG